MTWEHHKQYVVFRKRASAFNSHISDSQTDGCLGNTLSITDVYKTPVELPKSVSSELRACPECVMFLMPSKVSWFATLLCNISAKDKK